MMFPGGIAFGGFAFGGFFGGGGAVAGPGGPPAPEDRDNNVVVDPDKPAEEKKDGGADPVPKKDADKPAGQLQRGLDRIRQPAHERIAWFHHQPVDDDLDLVFLLFIERDILSQINELSVDASADIAGTAHVQQLLPVLPFSPTHDRRQNVELHALR